MRVETIGNATLYHADCADVVAGLEGIDALISDPPYGISVNTARLGTRRGRYVTTLTVPDFAPVIGDDQPFDPAQWLGYPKVILWGANHYCGRLPGSPHWLVWDKRLATGSDDNADCEIAWTNLKGPARMHRQLWRGICRQGEENISRKTFREHPTQKPIALMRWCIEQAGRPGKILDPYMGSGTTGVAAVSMGLSFVGIEVDAGYFDISCERIKAAQDQLRLFA